LEVSKYSSAQTVFQNIKREPMDPNGMLAPSLFPLRPEAVSLFDHLPMVHEVMVFRTSVRDEAQASALGPAMDRLIGAKGQWNFDLDDRDRILRVDARHVTPGEVIALLNRFDHACNELD
jgi:hypothetical protein